MLSHHLLKFKLQLGKATTRGPQISYHMVRTRNNKLVARSHILFGSSGLLACSFYWLIDWLIDWLTDFCFLGLQLRHMEVFLDKGLIGAIATDLHHSHSKLDPSHVFDLPHSSWQQWIVNPLSEATDQTYILMDTSRVRYCWATAGTPTCSF